ncbi:MAG TPA: hypothetical protein VH500_23450 [Nitrososphaeraceae archaeon]
MDLSNFKYNNIEKLNLVKARTLAKIQNTFDLSKRFKAATTIWSGNGYHLYIPTESHNTSLEQMSEFRKYQEPSRLLLRFSEWYLSNGMADSEHYRTVSFRNCLLRIPGSYNSKNMSQVSIVQKWNGISKVPLELLYGKFLAYLIDQDLKGRKLFCDNKTDSFLSVNSIAFKSQKNESLDKRSIDWIERLLQMPLAEHRKYCIWRILSPYFINVKHLSFGNSYIKIYQWLDRCSELKSLDFNPKIKINDSLNRAACTGYLPISFDNPLKEPRTLKIDNRELYNIIKY